MKTYCPVSSEAIRCIEKMQKKHHPDLKDVVVGALFVYDEEETSKQVLKHGGYPAAAVIKITGLKDRALGVADAVIIIDRASWLTLKGDVCEALIDHELTHLERAMDEDTGKPKFDVLNRPKLTTRLHDRQFGWFDEVAQRHGEKSMEIRQARALIAETQQLYFDFEVGATAPGSALTERVEAAVEHALADGKSKDVTLPSGVKATVTRLPGRKPRARPEHPGERIN